MVPPTASGLEMIFPESVLSWKIPHAAVFLPDHFQSRALPVMARKIHVFVSGCYDILHAGHIQFLREARALGDELTVCLAATDFVGRQGRQAA